MRRPESQGHLRRGRLDAESPVRRGGQQQVIDAFDIAPVPNPTVPNLTGTEGVNLHILADDGNAPGSDVIAHKDLVALEPCTPAAGTADANFDQA